MAFSFGNIGTSPVDDDDNVCVIPKPADLAVGDLMIAQMAFITTTSGSVTKPTGWTELHYTFADTHAAFSAVKIAEASDVSASDFTFTHSNAAGACFGKIAPLRGYRESTIDDVNAEAGSGGTPGTTVTVGTVTPNAANSLIIFMAYAFATNTSFSAYAMATDNPSWSELYDEAADNGTTDTTLALAYATRAAATATGDITATIAASRLWVGHVFIVEPQITFVATDAVNASDIAPKFNLDIIKTESVNAEDALTLTKDRMWETDAKSSSTWTNPDKP